MRFPVLLCLIIGLWSCKNDATSTTSEPVEKTMTTPTPSTTKAESNRTETKNIRSNNTLNNEGSFTSEKPAKNTGSILNNDATSSSNKSVSTGKFTTNYNDEGIPDACDMITVETIGKYLKIDPQSINISDGSSRHNNKQRACFFKWDGSAIKNAGVMLQIQQNPVEEDVPEYFTYFIQSKKTDGEKDFSNNNKIFEYNDWSGFGDDGAYSYEASKYLWRVGNEWAFMIAFNSTHDAKTQKRAAEALANEVMSRMPF